MTAVLARAVLVASGLFCAAVTLLPATIAALIALFDVGAHGLLGMSGVLLGLATPALGTGTGSGLSPYQGIQIDPARVAAISALRAIPPLGMIILPLISPKRLVWIACSTALACLTVGWPALPALPACLVMRVWGRPPPAGFQGQSP